MTMSAQQMRTKLARTYRDLLNGLSTSMSEPLSNDTQGYCLHRERLLSTEPDGQ